MPDCHICGESIDNPSRCDCASEMMKFCMERDGYRQALEQIRDLGPFITPGIPDQAYVISELALDPEGCADLARIPEGCAPIKTIAKSEFEALYPKP